MGEYVEFIFDKKVRETELAVLLRTHLGDLWFPKSQLKEFDEERGRAFVPEWLAVEKGLE